MPKQLDEHGHQARAGHRLEDAAIESIIDHYTREAGVRNLERQIASVVRGVAVKVAEGEDGPMEPSLDEEALRPYLGAPRFSPRGRRAHEPRPGVATGLAWTPVGGEILFIETHEDARHGKLQLTGQLGDVMKESAQTAMSYVRTRAKAFGIPRRLPRKE